jgi:hypothetical protein
MVQIVPQSLLRKTPAIRWQVIELRVHSFIGDNAGRPYDKNDSKKAQATGR